MRQLLLLRPEPGLSASAERARAMGLEVIECPLFRIQPVVWEAPDPDRYDALLLTSANAVRHGGDQLDALKSLPVHAVGEATAEAARAAGFRIVAVGSGDAVDLLESIPRTTKLLHVAGEGHRHVGDRAIQHRIAYRSVPIEEPGLKSLSGLVIAVHSPRAGKRLAELASSRGATMIAAISMKAANACSDGWERIEVAERPDDKSLLALAAMLCHTSPPT
jgi:uroporphyrinogen-III synthase